jgi:hypothetical protein
VWPISFFWVAPCADGLTLIASSSLSGERFCFSLATFADLQSVSKSRQAKTECFAAERPRSFQCNMDRSERLKLRLVSFHLSLKKRVHFSWIFSKHGSRYNQSFILRQPFRITSYRNQYIFYSNTFSTISMPQYNTASYHYGKIPFYVRLHVVHTTQF